MTTFKPSDRLRLTDKAQIELLKEQIEQLKQESKELVQAYAESMKLVFQIARTYHPEIPHDPLLIETEQLQYIINGIRDKQDPEPLDDDYCYRCKSSKEWCVGHSEWDDDTVDTAKVAQELICPNCGNEWDGVHCEACVSLQEDYKRRLAEQPEPEFEHVPTKQWLWAYVLHDQGTEQVEFDDLLTAIRFCRNYLGVIAYKIVDQQTNHPLVDNTSYDTKRDAWNAKWANDFLSRLDDTYGTKSE